MITLQERVHGVALPDSWKLAKLHRILRVRKGNKNVGMQEENLLSLSYGRIVRKDIDSAEGLLPESFETYQIVDPGNIVMRLTDLQNDKRSLRQGLVHERGIITSAYDALEVESGNDPRFWFYSLLALDLAKYYYSLGGGVRQSIKFSDFPNEWISAADKTTQSDIADFLDRETARIDQLIEKKLHLTKTIHTARSSAVLKALSAGFSGLEYDSKNNKLTFLNLQSGWELKRLKRVAGHMTSGSRAWSDQIRDEGELFLQSGSITTSMGVSLDNAQRISPQEGAEADRTRVRAADVLVCITGGRTGAVGFIESLSETAYVNQHVCLIRPNPKRIQPRLLAQMLFSEIGQLQFSLAQYGLKQGLGFSEVANVIIPCPPLELQPQISREIAETTQRLNLLTERISTSIRTLNDFRSSLITAAVTGKIEPAEWRRTEQVDRRLNRIEEAIRA